MGSAANAAGSGCNRRSQLRDAGSGHNWLLLSRIIGQLCADSKRGTFIGSEYWNITDQVA
jgi:hypothetical protein